MRRKILTYVCCCTVMLFAGVSVFAKKGPPPPPNNKEYFDGPGPPGLPIDGGLSYLLLAGAAYGVYAIKKNKKLNGL